MTFANSLYPNQDQQNESWTGSKLFATQIVFLEVFKKVNFEKNQQMTTYREKLPSMQS